MYRFLAFSLACSSCAFGQGSIIVNGHLDLSFNYEFSNTSWNLEIAHGDFDAPLRSPFNEVALPLRDFPAGSGGERFAVPDSAVFDFLGADPGEPIWIISQTDSGYTWPGFRNDQSDGSLAAYTSIDSRVSQLGDQQWIKISLVGVNYLGAGSNPQFSMWQSASGIQVWGATSDGIDSTDAYYQFENSHSHVNWGFTEKGVYQLNLQASAFTGPNQTGLVESTVEGAIFTVGTYATWKAGYFSGAELVSEAVTGVATDLEGDKVPLLLEYAFNLSPDENDHEYLVASSGTAGLPLVEFNNGELSIEYIRRKQETSPDISYMAQYSTDLGDSGWQTISQETVNSIDDTWERVNITMSTNSADQYFARVLVRLEP
ncbi:MAG: choice-of-anchor M domain-containing protein [Verrucomicrobiota bacterium]